MCMCEIKRVEYGKKSTPKQDREYRLLGGSPVGTIKDWLEYIADNPNIVGVRVHELDGSIEEIFEEV